MQFNNCSASNMKQINVKNWEEFEIQRRALEDECLQNKCSSKFLYRGQEDHTWGLLTTLERNGKSRLSLREYHHLIFVAKPQIESFTGCSWNILSYPKDFEEWLKKNDTLIPNAFGWSPEFQDTYSYMTYLRHYGFPSPFLDWTISPYVAAYFAFRQASKSGNHVSIYVYLESTSQVRLKSGSSDKPFIHRFGPYVKTDRRHFVQQSQYTFCIIKEDGEWQYAKHEEAFDRCDPDQDVLWKFNIPYSERLNVLKLLDSYNINALSLFGSEEGLMETVALREIHLKDRGL